MPGTDEKTSGVRPTCFTSSYLETAKKPPWPRSWSSTCRYTGASARRRRKRWCGNPRAKVSGSARLTPRSKLPIRALLPNDRLSATVPESGTAGKGVAGPARTPQRMPRGVVSRVAPPYRRPTKEDEEMGTTGRIGCALAIAGALVGTAGQARALVVQRTLSPTAAAPGARGKASFVLRHGTRGRLRLTAKRLA